MHYRTASAVLFYFQQLAAALQSTDRLAPRSYDALSVGKIDWESASAKADVLISQLNITEKVNLVTGAVQGLDAPCVGNILGVKRLNFSGLCLYDGPLAINRADLVSVFPAGISVGATWDKNLMYLRSLAMGEEFRAKGIHVALTPVAGALGRHPLAGRNWEGFSPDPYLSGIAMNASITGIQQNGVQATAKHYVGNEQELQRTNSALQDGTVIQAISSNIGERSLHELYAWPFYDSVKAGTSAVMCSYQRINETYACENNHTLNTILKEQMGFKGYVMSDWFATHSNTKAVNAGLDMNMPGPVSQGSLFEGTSLWGLNLEAVVLSGDVPVERLDDMVRRIMTPYYWLGQDKNYPTPDPSFLPLTGVSSGYRKLLGQFGISLVPARDVRGDHAKIIRQVGAAGHVLLKNSNNTLPLKAPKEIGVFGNDAADIADGLTPVDPINAPNEFGWEYGTLDIGGGSGGGRHSRIVAPLRALQNRVESDGGRVQYILNNDIIVKNDFHSIYPTPDACLVFLKTWATETTDRKSWEADWSSTPVVENVASICPNTIVITHSAGINTMPWAMNPNVTAIIAAHLPGEETGNALVDILYGVVNPSGRLPYTIPKNPDDYNIPIVNLTGVTDPNGWQSNFTEGLFIDYRHFDAKNITPLYEFGYGLSYTTFELIGKIDIKASVERPGPTPDPSLEVKPGGNPDLWVELVRAKTTVRNTGSTSGSSVVQLYASYDQDAVPAGTPVKVLRGFEKVPLDVGEEKEVSFSLTRRDLSYWDEASNEWQLPSGHITLRIGFSSRDLPQEESIVLRQ